MKSFRRVADHRRGAQSLEREIGAGRNEALTAHAGQVPPFAFDSLAHAQRPVATLAAVPDADAAAR